MARANCGNVAPKQAHVQNHNPAPIHPPQNPVQIKIDDAAPVDLEGEEEIDVEEEEESGEESELLLDKLNTATRAIKRGLEELKVIRSLKRGSEELDNTSDPDRSLEGERGGTPPKRARMERKVAVWSPARVPTPEPLKKRSSEELDDHLETEVLTKRAKVGTEMDGESSDGGVMSPPTSINGTESIPSEEPEDGKDVQITSVPRAAHQPRAHSYVSHPRSFQPQIRAPPPAPLTVREADLDQLYTFEAEVDV